MSRAQHPHALPQREHHHKLRTPAPPHPIDSTNMAGSQLSYSPGRRAASATPGGSIILVGIGHTIGHTSMMLPGSVHRAAAGTGKRRSMPCTPSMRLHGRSNAATLPAMQRGCNKRNRSDAGRSTLRACRAHPTATSHASNSSDSEFGWQSRVTRDPTVHVDIAGKCRRCSQATCNIHHQRHVKLQASHP
eukprot:363578-Chlamydomonas_euryale.AAC.6